jgi:hypothetical protein
MNKTIWKFPLQIMDRQEIKVPMGAQILSVQVQDGIPCMWAMVEPDSSIFDTIYIEIFGTGHPIDCGNGNNRKFISTIQLRSLVFHVFERWN